ncbi:hypothetical protein PFISCL1PPCAC_12252, partial [Pristionchus fissidentatus]
LRESEIIDSQAVVDRVTVFLLTDAELSIHRKLLLSEKYSLQILKEEMLSLYGDKENLIELSKSVEFDQLSPEMIRSLFIKFFLKAHFKFITTGVNVRCDKHFFS